MANVFASSNQDWREAQDVWWQDEKLLKDTVVFLLRIRGENAGTAAQTSEIDWRLLNLLLLYDKRNDLVDINNLATLSGYYLGAAPGEVYSCLVLRKGKKIQPSLKELLKQNKNECPTQLDSTGHKISGKAVLRCLSAEDYERKLTAFINAIEKDQSCNIEQ